MSPSLLHFIMIFANVTSLSQDPSSLHYTFYNIRVETRLPCFPANANAQMHETNVVGKYCSGDRDELQRKKLATRAQNAAKCIIDLVRCGTSDRIAAEKTLLPVAMLTPSILAIDAECHSSNMRNRYYFTPIKFVHGKNGLTDPLVSTQYLHISMPPTQLQKAYDISARDSIFTSPFLVSGICLFNKATIDASLTRSRDGSLQHRCLLGTSPTLYELDSIARLSSAIADFISMFVKRGLTAIPSICLDIPHFHYYHAVLGMFGSNLCTHDEALRWITHINRRSRQIWRVTREAIRWQCTRRCIPEDAYNLDVSHKARSITGLIEASLRDASMPRLSELLNHLGNGDTIWQEFYHSVPTSNRPKDFKGLGHLLQVFETIRPALLSTVSNAVAPGVQHLILAIDDVAERPLYTRAHAILKALQRSDNRHNSNLTVAYMSPRLLANGKWNRNFYYCDESVAIDTHTIRENNSGYISSTLAPYDIIEKLHGSSVAANLDTWFQRLDSEAYCSQML